VSGYEVKYRAAIVRRWHELEALALPQTQTPLTAVQPGTDLAGQIEAIREIKATARQLGEFPQPSERAILLQCLGRLYEMAGMDKAPLPPVQALPAGKAVFHGKVQKRSPKLEKNLAQFWQQWRLLIDKGVILNYADQPGLIVVNMRAYRKACADAGLPCTTLSTLHTSLCNSAAPYPLYLMRTSLAQWENHPENLGESLFVFATAAEFWV